MDKKRKGKIKVLIFCLILCAIVIGSIFVIKYMRITFVTRTYAENSSKIINPSRGLYFQLDSKQWERMQEYYEDEDAFRVVLLAYDLSEEINKEEISPEKIKELEDALENARNTHMSVIFRGAYDFVGDYEDPKTFDSILNHVGQIAPVLNAYKDVVMGVQAGFLGPYGEWHSSDYIEYDAEQESYRVKLLKKMIESLDEEIVINVRRPMFIREAQAAGLPIERFGYHDDALLSTDTDMGTYVDEDYNREEELSWLNEHIKTPINGGEMTNVSEYTQAENAVKEFHQLQLTYLNRYYNVEVLKAWKQEQYEGENAYDYIINHLGYRLSFKEVTYQESLLTTKPFQISGQLRNSGFAQMRNGYQMFLVLKRGDEIHYEPIKSTQTKKESITFKGEVVLANLFENIQEGDIIEVGLAVSDHETIGENCMIKFANDEINYEQQVNFCAKYKLEDRKFQLQEE